MQGVCGLAGGGDEGRGGEGEDKGGGEVTEICTLGRGGVGGGNEVKVLSMSMYAYMSMYEGK